MDGHDIQTGADGVRLSEILRGFDGRRVMVVGDMVADAYIVGRPATISREAPVLVLHHREEFVCPGGAANVACNLAALGAAVSVGGVIGYDGWGNQLRESLVHVRIDVSGLVVDPLRATATKTRVVGRGEQEIQQQIVRIDRVDRSGVGGQVRTTLTDWITRSLDGAEAIIVSDYENGVMGPEVIEAAVPEAERRGLVVTVDSHGDLFRFKGVTLATPNQPEAEATLGRDMRTTAEVEAGGEELRRAMDAQAVLITRGNQGMSLVQRDGAPCHLPPANIREVFDPTGAGDTVSAVFTLALLAGGSMVEAATMCNLAAGEVVKKLGAATLTVQELQGAIDRLVGEIE